MSDRPGAAPAARKAMAERLEECARRAGKQGYLAVTMQEAAAMLAPPLPERGELIRCTSCESTFTPEQTAEHHGCPACGTHSVPCDPAFDFLLPINWHEARILVQWAENYVLASKMDGDSERTWEAIKKRIRASAPPGASGLTLFDEMDDLRAAGFDATLHQSRPKPPEDA